MFVLLLACQQSPSTSFDRGIPSPGCGKGEQLFGQGVVHRLELTLEVAAWDAFVEEARETPEYDGPPMTYRNATWTWDGTAAAQEVAIRPKGHYSRITAIGDAFPIKVDFDRVDPDQTVDGLSKLNLHPAGEAMGPVREHLSYGTLREAGMAVARTTFVQVFVNGEDLGLYNAVEQVNGDFIRCHFEEPYGDLYKPEEANGMLAWRGDRIEDYPVANHMWPDESDHASFLNLLDVINHQPVEAYETVLDVDGALDYLAANVAVGNFDYYATFGHNYYLYEAEPGRFTMIPWDMNLSQQGIWHPCGFGRNDATFPITHRLLADPRALATYSETLRDLTEGAGSEATVDARLDDAMELVGEWVDGEVEGELRELIAFRVAQLTDRLPQDTTCPETVE